ncbi:MAG: bacterial transcriptional activator domain-containing protein [Pirellula sp.]|jgi:tetratricopeptide (TPR) repeat protein|nr:bacterial transcriptional activator domain-containing protein [Pirellula sp.]
MTKLLQFYENYLADSYGDPLSVVISAEENRNSMRWIDQVGKHYSSATLMRLLDSTEVQTRRAATWALCFLGNETHYTPLGRMLRDESRAVRTSADEARRAIARRTQSPWHRKTAYQVEQLLADENYLRAEELASHLIDETDGRGDVYYLRAWIRFTRGDIEEALSDCKRSIRLDPYSYQACVALGQCYWHLGNDGAARECYLESNRIYPDWEPARSAMEILAGES